jgi:LEA14-like dessication related protein
MSSMGRRGALSVLVVSAVLLAAGACAKPQPPQLTPKEAKVTAVDLTGFDLRVKLEAFNPNGFDLSVQSVVAHVVVDGTRDLGTVTSPFPFNLPANARTVIDAPLNVKWKGAADFASLATSKRPIPYTIDGTAAVGGSSLNVEVPFKLQGVITPEQLQQAGLKSLQAIPGLQGLPNLLPK